MRVKITGNESDKANIDDLVQFLIESRATTVTYHSETPNGNNEFIEVALLCVDKDNAEYLTKARLNELVVN